MNKNDLFEKLNKLEGLHLIAIGVTTDYANTLWANQSLFGKFLNMATLIYFGFIGLFIFKANFIALTITIFLVLVHTFVTRKIATTWFRLKVLKDVVMFQSLYDTRAISILHKPSKEVVVYPSSWQDFVESLS